jgi:hypothetical protein
MNANLRFRLAWAFMHIVTGAVISALAHFAAQH